MADLRRRIHARVHIFVALIGFIILFHVFKGFWFNVEVKDRVQVKRKTQDPNATKTILLWLPASEPQSLEKWFLENDTFSHCPSRCNFTFSQDEYNSTDAIIFRRFDYTVPYRERSDQIWTIFTLASPLGQPSYVHKYFESSFSPHNINWTMNYRRDSDIYWPFGKFLPISNSTQDFDDTITSHSNKSGNITWLSSTCVTSNHRQFFVNNLTQFIPVDNFGACKPHRSHCLLRNDCYRYLAQSYKFFLVAERAFCKDFLTETYYHVLQAGMIPIIHAHPSFTQLALNGTYINVADYKSPADLAKYLRFLHANPEELGKYFQWRKSYRIVTRKEIARQTWCEFCRKLHGAMEDDVEITKSYEDIPNWFLYDAKSKKDQCIIESLTSSDKEFFSMFRFVNNESSASSVFAF